MSLPDPLDLLNTLLASLSADSPPPAPDPSPHPHLHALAPPQRALLVTLHAIFPALLLPALDVVDRGLAARLRLGGAARMPAVFLVHSASGADAADAEAGAGANRYVVRLGPWHCSCPAYALQAFAGSTQIGAGAWPVFRAEACSDGNVADALSIFGGLVAAPTLPAQVDPTSSVPEGPALPCCKHLLACLLLDRCAGALGTTAVERVVEREEMAGIVAGVL